MPTNRKRINRGRVIGAGGITEADYIYYTWGDFFEAENYADGKTEKELKLFWKNHRAAIMKRYLEENREKKWVGVRPLAFWKYEARKPRLKTEAKEFDSLRVWDHQRLVYDWVETDFDYLKRLKLLEPWELEAK